MFKYGRLSLILALLIGFSTGAQASSPIASFGEWSLFVKDQNKQIICYMVAVPTKKGGSYQSRNGEPFFIVSKSEGSGANPEISVSSGVIYQDKSNVDLAIGKRKFTLFTVDTKAWSNSVEEDVEIINRMKKGVSATVEGIATNGKSVKDTYSLTGFTETYNRLMVLCK